MQMIRTTLRIKADLKKQVEKYAVEKDTTFQNIFNIALEEYLCKKAENKAKKLVIPTIDLGVPLDNLTRDDYYDEPNLG